MLQVLIKQLYSVNPSACSNVKYLGILPQSSEKCFSPAAHTQPFCFIHVLRVTLFTFLFFQEHMHDKGL